MLNNNNNSQNIFICFINNFMDFIATISPVSSVVALELPKWQEYS